MRNNAKPVTQQPPCTSTSSPAANGGGVSSVNGRATMARNNAHDMLSNFCENVLFGHGNYDPKDLLVHNISNNSSSSTSRRNNSDRNSGFNGVAANLNDMISAPEYSSRFRPPDRSSSMAADDSIVASNATITANQFRSTPNYRTLISDPGPTARLRSSFMLSADTVNGNDTNAAVLSNGHSLFGHRNPAATTGTAANSNSHLSPLSIAAAAELTFDSLSHSSPNLST